MQIAQNLPNTSGHRLRIQLACNEVESGWPTHVIMFLPMRGMSDIFYNDASSVSILTCDPLLSFPSHCVNVMRMLTGIQASSFAGFQNARFQLSAPYHKMVPRQASPTRASAQATLPNSLADLDHLCLSARTHGLGYLWDEFESRICDVLLENTTESRVGVASLGSDHLQWVTTPREICTTVGKGKSSLL